MWIDTHCHLDAPEFDADRDAVVARARAAGVAQHRAAGGGGGQLRRRARAGARARPGLRAGHPPAVRASAPPTPTSTACADALHAQRDDPRLVAVGEIGLDHFVPGLDRAAPGALLRRAAAAGARARPAGDPARAALGRRAAEAPAPHRRWPAASRTPSTAARSRRRPSSSSGFKLGFGGALTFERALQIRRLARDAAADGARCSRPTRPTSRRTGCTAPPRERAARRRPARNEPAELPRIAADAGRRCAAGRSTRLASATAANALRRAAAAGRLGG